MCKHSVRLIRVSKHSIVSHRSPASESGIFLLSERLKMGKKNATRFGVAVHKPKALRSEAESMLIRSLLRHLFSNQLGRGQKKRPPVTGRRSNYAHLTDINLQAPRHNSVKPR